MTKNEDISNPFEVTERKTLAAQNIVDKNNYLTIVFFSQHSTHLDTCPNFHPHSLYDLICVQLHDDMSCILPQCLTFQSCLQFVLGIFMSSYDVDR